MRGSFVADVSIGDVESRSDMPSKACMVAMADIWPVGKGQVSGQPQEKDQLPATRNDSGHTRLRAIWSWKISNQ